MITAIITAGGSGTRLRSSSKKQFLEIAGKPMLIWTIIPFTKNKKIEEIIITLPEDEIKKFKKIVEQEFADFSIRCITGGSERQNSVCNALQVCSSDCKTVLIHDGVRPFISSEDLELLLKTALSHQAVIPVDPVKNTIKKVKDGFVSSTLERDEIYNALTPQVFDFDLIMKCHLQAQEENVSFTDDASLLEHYGFPVKVVETSSKNFKITDIDDLNLARLILESSS